MEEIDLIREGFKEAIANNQDKKDLLQFYADLVENQLGALMEVGAVSILKSKEFPKPQTEPVLSSLEMQDMANIFLSHLNKVINIYQKHLSDRKDTYKFLASDKINNLLKDNINEVIVEPSTILGNEDIPEENIEMIIQIMDFTRSFFYIKAARQISSELDLSLWSQGYCPICGTFASYGRIDFENMNRILFCPLCWQEWNFMRIKCVNCGNKDPRKQEYIYLEDFPQYRMYLCNECQSFIKITDERHNKNKSWSLIDEMITGNLDDVAIQRGYKPAGR